MNFDGFGSQFERVLGKGAVESLTASFTSTPVILLAGDQASGKSTAAKLIAEQLGGVVGSTGALVRARAVEAGISFEEFNARMREHPDADVTHDYLAASAIAMGRVVVFESRLAGHLGAWLRALGRRGLFSAYLRCSPRERALRVLERATSAMTRARAERDGLGHGDDISDILTSLADISDPQIVQVVHQLRSAAARDARDRDRIRHIYGIDYADESSFDTSVDSSSGQPPATAALVLGRWRRSCGGHP